MFKDVFVQLLQTRNISAYQLAKDTGITQGMISYWKKGERTPSVENLTTLADYFGCTTDYLLGKTDDPTPAAQKEKPVFRGGDGLSADEAALIQLFHQVPPEDRQLVLDMIRAALKNR